MTDVQYRWRNVGRQSLLLLLPLMVAAASVVLRQSSRSIWVELLQSAPLAYAAGVLAILIVRSLALKRAILRYGAASLGGALIGRAWYAVMWVAAAAGSVGVVTLLLTISAVVVSLSLSLWRDETLTLHDLGAATLCSSLALLVLAGTHGKPW